MAMNENQLDALIGRRVAYAGRLLQVIDWVPEVPALVLADTAVDDIQPDQFGDARRRAPRTWTVPVYDPDTGALHPLIRDLAG